MSNTFYKVNGYVSAATTIVSSWFLLPEKMIEIAEPAIPNAGIITTISSGISIISSATALTYQYDKYIKLRQLAKWLIFCFVGAHIIAIGGVFYLLAKQEGIEGKISKYISKLLVPIITALIGIYHIVDMIADCDNSSAYRIIYSINALLSLADFLPIHEAIKTQPEIYFPVHGVRALLQTAEGGTLFVEVASTKEEPRNVSAIA